MTQTRWSQRERMLRGELYDPLDPELVSPRARARDLCQELNATRESEQGRAPADPARALRRRRRHVWMQPPFHCDYGANIRLGKRCFFNFNCVVLDVCAVTIGDFTLFGPAVQIYTATHPMDAELRRTQEFGRPVDDRFGRLGRRRSDPLPGRARSDRVRSSAREAWSRATFPRTCSRPGTRAGSSTRSTRALRADPFVSSRAAYARLVLYSATSLLHARSASGLL